MHIRRLIFASLSWAFASLVYAVQPMLEPLQSFEWPRYSPTAAESITLDRVRTRIATSATPRQRFKAFLERAQLHTRYTAGGFATS